MIEPRNLTNVTDRLNCWKLKYHKIKDPIRDGLISKNQGIDTPFLDNINIDNSPH
ncbi:hypothetical protein Hanom_Chr00s007211g01737251 [Helianthus anomalus]